MNELDAEQIYATLEEHGVAYVTVGGLALAAHGVVRATLDVDIIPSPMPENLERLADAINSLGGAPRGEPSTRVTAALLARDANPRFYTIAGQLDVLLTEHYRRMAPDLIARAERFQVGLASVVVVSRNDLIRLKAGSGRERDVLDIGDLLALDEA